MDVKVGDKIRMVTSLPDFFSDGISVNIGDEATIKSIDSTVFKYNAVKETWPESAALREGEFEVIL